MCVERERKEEQEKEGDCGMLIFIRAKICAKVCSMETVMINADILKKTNYDKKIYKITINYVFIAFWILE